MKSLCTILICFLISFPVSAQQIIVAKKKAGAGGTTFLSDSFTETSDTALESHSPETGGTWGGDATSLSVMAANDVVMVENNSARYSAHNSAAPTDNTYYVTVTGACGANNSVDEFGAVARWDSSSGWDGYQCKLKGNGALVLRVYESGTSVDLNGASGKDITSWFTSTTTYKIKLIVAGSSYTDISCEVYEGSTLKDSTTASSHTVETRTGTAGIHLYNGNASVTSIEATDQ